MQLYPLKPLQTPMNLTNELHTHACNLINELHTNVCNLTNELHTNICNLTNELHTNACNLTNELHTNVCNSLVKICISGSADYVPTQRYKCKQSAIIKQSMNANYRQITDRLVNTGIGKYLLPRN